jgi:hypothetical protein
VRRSLSKTGSSTPTVALIARSKERLGELTELLTAEGVKASGFPADVTDRAALASALHNAAEQLGAIDVMHCSAPPAGSSEAVRTRERWTSHVSTGIYIVLGNGRPPHLRVIDAQPRLSGTTFTDDLRLPSPPRVKQMRVHVMETDYSTLVWKPIEVLTGKTILGHVRFDPGGQGPNGSWVPVTDA